MINKNNYPIIFFILLFIAANLYGQADLAGIYSGDANSKSALRKAYLNGELKNDKAFKSLIKYADKLLKMSPLSVVDKEQVPPDGDKHNFMSMAPYWWPNPDTKDGLPYIRKDGEKNPEIFKITDDAYLAEIISSVPILSAAYFITEDPKYSSKAAELLRVWFLDDKTKMNPNLNYAQYVPGRNTGRDAGIIDTHGIYRILDAISILQNSKEWSGNDNTKMKRWLDDYLNWLRTSKNGIDESKTKNNHGTWYDVQVVSILLFNGRDAEAGEYLEKVTKKRIDNQIKEDGKQPEELIRTKAMGYSEFNLTALFRIAVLAERAGVDLWNYKGDDGGSIRKALDFLLPYVLEPGKWEYKQIAPFKTVDVYPLLLMAQKKYDAKIYGEWTSRIFGNQKISTENIF